MRAGVIACILGAACSIPLDPDTVDAGGKTDASDASSELDAEHWSSCRCAPPSPGFEFGCVAVCESVSHGTVRVLCNQKASVCNVAAGAQEFARCAAPREGSGCAICQTAVNGCLSTAF